MLKSLILVFCLLFSEVAALTRPKHKNKNSDKTAARRKNSDHVASQRNNNSNSSGNDDLRSFVSDNGLFCGQSSPRIAEGALALYKAMPRGKLFKDTYIFQNSTLSCKQRGYEYYLGEDPCYPGLKTFYKNHSMTEKFYDSIQMTLLGYGLDHPDYSLSFLNKMDACICNSEGPVAKYYGDTCSEVNNITAYWTHHHPESGKGLMCESGPFVLVARALAVLKSTSQMPLHRRDHVTLVSCSDQGFTFQSPDGDNCFTGLHLWTITNDTKTDPDLNEARLIENQLLDGGFETFIDQNDLDPAIRPPHSNCHCAADSKSAQSQHDCIFPGASSQIRDWWRE